MTDKTNHHLLKQAHDVQKRHGGLLARKNECERGRVKWMGQLHKANERLLAAPLVQELLEKVQRREHEKAVGVYEQLLGAFLSDVLPGERFINMDLYTERGSPALDIYIKKGEQAPLEDAFLGTGGSVTNLLSTGLRLVALLRSGQRRFLVLDESDCWIEPALIPKYASIVEEMSRTLDVQILMISHHSESLFEKHIPYRLTMSRKSSLVTVDWTVSSEIPIWGAEQEGIRSLALKNFQSHQHTIIPLSPHVTLLQGANDIGKSAVSNALRAVFEGESNDTIIQHGKSSAQVSIDFGTNNLVTWERFRKGKIKVSYKMFDNQHQLIHATDGTKVPEWLSEHSKIGKIEGLDVQIGQQQDPVFLLNQPPSQRAKALSIGHESGHIQTMIALDKQSNAEAKQQVKQGEKILEELRREMDVLEHIETDLDFVQSFQELQDKEKRTQELKTILFRWKRQRAIKNVLDVQHTNIVVPKIHHKERQILKAWGQLKKKHETLCVEFKNLRYPQQKRLTALKVFLRWEEKNKTLEVLGLLKNTPKTTPRNTNQQQKVLLKRLQEKWNGLLLKKSVIEPLGTFDHHTMEVQTKQGELLRRWMMAQQLLLNTENNLLLISSEQEKLQKLSPVCPCCGQKWHQSHEDTTKIKNKDKEQR